MKEYAIEYMSTKDKGWIHYSFFDTIDEAKASLLELTKEADGDAFTKEFRIVKEIDVNNKSLITKKGITASQCIEWLKGCDPDKKIQARDNNGDWCEEIQLCEMVKNIYIQSLPEEI